MTIQELFKFGMDRELNELLDIKGNVVLNLGAGNKLIPGTIPIDLPVHDIEKEGLMFDSDTVDGIHAYHFLEHMRNPIYVLTECQRVLKIGGIINICVPYYASQMAFQDLNHESFYTIDTWNILMKNKYYHTHYGKGHEWQLKVNFNVIIGIVERNLSILTQMVKV